MRVLLATGSPGTITFAGPITWWTNTASEFSRIKLVAGDFNLDGRADVVEFYDYGGERTAIFMHYASGTGFPGGTQQWDSGAGNWAWSHGKYVVGDFSGDGRPDIAVLYDYNNSQVSLLVFPANASGSFAGGWQSWWGAGAAWRWNFDATEAVPGDINADGRSDISLVHHCCGALQPDQPGRAGDPAGQRRRAVSGAVRAHQRPLHRRLGGPLGNTPPISQTSCGYGWNPMLLKYESGGIGGIDATVSIRPMYSGYVLDVSGYGTADGSLIWQYQWLNGTNQKFTLRPVT